MSCRFAIWMMLALGCLGFQDRLQGQAVGVTLRLDTNVITVGSTTLLHVAAQVLPAQRPNADRIFSWYVDLLNGNELAAATDYNRLQKTASDNDPQFSSAGIADGANRRGIYDTFMNLPGAGKDAPVDLLVVPVTGLAPGWTSFRIQPGTGVTNLAADFIVAPSGGGDPWLGGDYSVATVNLLVVDPTSLPRFQSVTHTNSANGANQVMLSFEVQPDFDSQVEYLDTIGDLAGWQVLPGAPHNLGVITDVNPSPNRFYRLRSSLRTP